MEIRGPAYHAVVRSAAMEACIPCFLYIFPKCTYRAFRASFKRLTENFEGDNHVVVEHMSETCNPDIFFNVALFTDDEKLASLLIEKFVGDIWNHYSLREYRTKMKMQQQDVQPISQQLMTHLQYDEFVRENMQSSEEVECGKEAMEEAFKQALHAFD
jgi:hypothetical protein